MHHPLSTVVQIPFLDLSTHKENPMRVMIKITRHVHGFTALRNTSEEEVGKRQTCLLTCTVCLRPHRWHSLCSYWCEKGRKKEHILNIIFKNFF